MIYRMFTFKYMKILFPMAMIAIGSAAGVLATNDTKDIEKAVLGANESFYRAFADRDIAKMEALWATDKPVAEILRPDPCANALRRGHPQRNSARRGLVV